MTAPAIGVVVASNASVVASALMIFGRDQLPFATAVALTRTAKDAHGYVVTRMGSHFTIRSKRTVKGTRFEAARKTDWPHPQAKVGTVDEFMVLQVTGGAKRPQKGAAHIAVPTRVIRRTASGAIPREKKPRPLRERPDVFVSSQLSNQREQIRQRVANRSSRVANLGVATLYSLVREAKIKKRWPLPEEVREKAATTYGPHFDRELTAAVKSARVRAGSFSSEQARALYLKARRQMGRIPE